MLLIFRFRQTKRTWTNYFVYVLSGIAKHHRHLNE